MALRIWKIKTLHEISVSFYRKQFLQNKSHIIHNAQVLCIVRNKSAELVHPLTCINPKYNLFGIKYNIILYYILMPLFQLFSMYEF